MLKWIVSDMDGTLLNSKDRIMSRTKEALFKFQKNGGRIILASGRSYSRLMPYAQELNMAEYGGLLIEVNGMAVYDTQTERRNIIRRFTRPEIEEIFGFCKELGTEIQCFQDTSVYYMIPEWQRSIKEEERKRRNLPEDYPDLGGAWTWITDTTKGYPVQVKIKEIGEVPFELNKINCVADADTNREAFRKLKQRFGEKYEFVRTCPRLIEISPKGVTKGAALERIMKMYGISKDEVFVFGDGENDVDMFKKVNYSFAMDNAEDFVKEQAYAVTDSNDRDGIADILAEYERDKEKYGGCIKDKAV